MKITIRTVREEEIPAVAVFLTGGQEDWGRIVTAQFHRQKELVVGAFKEDSQEILGVLFAQGQGDTVAIIKMVAISESLGELRKRLLLAVEKVSRDYGYRQIRLVASKEKMNFLLNLGYSPRLTFTFSEKRREVFEALAELYPMWVEAGGQKVTVILGGDYLEAKIKEKIEKLPIKTELLFLKQL